MSKASAARLNFDSLFWALMLLVAAIFCSSQLRICSTASNESGASNPLTIGLDAAEPTPARPLADVPFETATGQVESLAQTNGHARIVTTFYSHCPGSCPLALRV